MSREINIICATSGDLFDNANENDGGDKGADKRIIMIAGTTVTIMVMVVRRVIMMMTFYTIT